MDKYRELREALENQRAELREKPVVLDTDCLRMMAGALNAMAIMQAMEGEAGNVAFAPVKVVRGETVSKIDDEFQAEIDAVLESCKPNPVDGEDEMPRMIAEYRAEQRRQESVVREQLDLDKWKKRASDIFKDFRNPQCDSMNARDQ